MNAKFPILIAAGLFFAGVSKAQYAGRYDDHRVGMARGRYDERRDRRAVEYEHSRRDHRDYRGDRREYYRDRNDYRGGRRARREGYGY
jgi:hypothetical protein